MTLNKQGSIWLVSDLNSNDSIFCGFFQTFMLLYFCFGRCLRKRDVIMWMFNLSCCHWNCGHHSSVCCILLITLNLNLWDKYLCIHLFHLFFPILCDHAVVVVLLIGFACATFKPYNNCLAEGVFDSKVCRGPEGKWEAKIPLSSYFHLFQNWMGLEERKKSFRICWLHYPCFFPKYSCIYVIPSNPS